MRIWRSTQEEEPRSAAEIGLHSRGREGSLSACGAFVNSPRCNKTVQPLHYCPPFCYLYQHCTRNNKQIACLLINIKKALDSGDMEPSIELIDILFYYSHQDLSAKTKAFFHAVLAFEFFRHPVCWFRPSRAPPKAMDTVVHTRDRIYVMEFKLDATSDQPEPNSKALWQPFLNQGKRSHCFGGVLAQKKLQEWQVPYTSYYWWKGKYCVQ